MAAPRTLEFASPQQEQCFLAPPSGPLLYLGGFGAAKTTTLVLKALWVADTFPGAQIALIRKQSGQLRKTTVATLLIYLPPDRIARYNEQAGIIELTNGSKLFLIHLDSEDSLGVLKSLELNAAFVDQAEEIDEDAFDMLHARIGRWAQVKLPALAQTPSWPYRDQSGMAVAPAWLVLAANSPGFGHWLERRFSPSSPEAEKWKALGYRLIVSSSRDNRFLSKDYMGTLLSKDGDWVKRYVDGAWGASEGQIFSISNLSLLEPTEELLDKIRLTMKLHRSLDHGDSSPTACLWHGTDSDGNIFVYREYYVPGALISQHREAITKLSEGERYSSNLADPSIFFQTAQKHGGKWSVADEYSDGKVMPYNTRLLWAPADNAEEASRSRLREYLRVDPDHLHPITREKGSPRLFFLMRRASYPVGCDHVIAELRAQKLVKLSEGVWSDERDDKVVDHAYDALKYFVVSRPSAQQAVKTAPSINTWKGYADFSVKKRKDRSRSLPFNGGSY